MIEYTAERQLSINRQQVLMIDLEQRLRTVFEERSDKTLFITAAGTLRYGEVVDVIDAAKGAGVRRHGSRPRTFWCKCRAARSAR